MNFPVSIPDSKWRGFPTCNCPHLICIRTRMKMIIKWMITPQGVLVCQINGRRGRIYLLSCHAFDVRLAGTTLTQSLVKCANHFVSLWALAGIFYSAIALAYFYALILTEPRVVAYRHGGCGKVANDGHDKRKPKIKLSPLTWFTKSCFLILILNQNDLNVIEVSATKWDISGLSLPDFPLRTESLLIEWYAYNPVHDFCYHL